MRFRSLDKHTLAEDTLHPYYLDLSARGGGNDQKDDQETVVVMLRKSLHIDIDHYNYCGRYKWSYFPGVAINDGGIMRDLMCLGGTLGMRISSVPPSYIVKL